MIKPKKLYRAIVLNIDEFMHFDFSKDMTPHIPPISIKDNIPRDRDGNEYGLYMSDVLEVATEKYGEVGNPSNGGPSFYDDTFIGVDYQPKKIWYPRISIIFEISTDGISPRIPIQTGQWGETNRGDTEYIIDSIPASNYMIKEIQISPDILNDNKITIHKESFNSDEECINCVKKIISKRENGYGLFKNDRDKHIGNRALTATEMKMYKHLYSENGIILNKEYDIDPNNPKDVLDSIMRETFYRDPQNYNFEKMLELYKLYENQNIKSVEDLINAIVNNAKKPYNANKQDIYEEILNDAENYYKKRNKLNVKEK